MDQPVPRAWVGRCAWAMGCLGVCTGLSQVSAVTVTSLLPDPSLPFLPSSVSWRTALLFSGFLIHLASGRHWWKSQGWKKEEVRVFFPCSLGWMAPLQCWISSITSVPSDGPWPQLLPGGAGFWAVLLPSPPFVLPAGNVVASLDFPCCTSTVAMRSTFSR